MNPKEQHSGGAFQWEKSHWRTGIDKSLSVPVRGYGLDGKYTLWLPSTEVKRAVKFVNGKASFAVTGGGDKEIDEYRSRIITSYSAIKRDGIPYLPVDEHIFNFSAMLIARNYDVNDDDLTMLHSGLGWVENVCVLALGGEKARDALASSGFKKSADQAAGETEPGVFVEAEDGEQVELALDLSLNPKLPDGFE